MSKLEEIIAYWEKYYENRNKIMNETTDVNLKSQIRIKLHLVQGFIDDLKYANGVKTSQDEALHKHIVVKSEATLPLREFMEAVDEYVYEQENHEINRSPQRMATIKCVAHRCKRFAKHLAK
jgi:hypothetical protein